MNGSLEVRVMSAYDLRHVQSLGRQDPYVVLRIGTFTETTKVAKDAGRQATWNESMHFHIGSEAAFTVSVMDKNKLLSDKFIGSATIPLGPVRQQRSQKVAVGLLDERRRPAGSIELHLLWRAPDAPAQHSVPGNPYIGRAEAHAVSVPGASAPNGYPSAAQPALDGWSQPVAAQAGYQRPAAHVPGGWSPAGAGAASSLGNSSPSGHGSAYPDVHGLAGAYPGGAAATDGRLHPSGNAYPSPLEQHYAYPGMSCDRPSDAPGRAGFSHASGACAPPTHTVPYPSCPVAFHPHAPGGSHCNASAPEVGFNPGHVIRPPAAPNSYPLPTPAACTHAAPYPDPVGSDPCSASGHHHLRPGYAYLGAGTDGYAPEPSAPPALSAPPAPGRTSGYPLPNDDRYPSPAGRSTPLCHM